MSHRSVQQIYRDCIRLIIHNAGNSRKAQLLRDMVRKEFRKNMHETDPAKIDQLKGNAIRALTNYMTMESLSRLKQNNKRAEEKIDQQFNETM